MSCPFGSKENQQKGFYKNTTRRVPAGKNPTKALTCFRKRSFPLLSRRESGAKAYPFAEPVRLRLKPVPVSAIGDRTTAKVFYAPKTVNKKRET